MKTPEEIKKALKLCQNGSCKFCPYDDDEACGLSKNGDALAYIHQLEEGIDRVAQLVQSINELIKEKLKEMESRLAQAGNDAKEMANNMDCSACTWCEYGDFDDNKEACKACRTYNEGFKLRGVCPENAKEE